MRIGKGDRSMSKGLIHYIEIYVSDLNKSINFWGWLFEERLLKRIY